MYRDGEGCSMMEGCIGSSFSEFDLSLEDSDAGGCGHMKTVKGRGETPGIGNSIARSSSV